MKFVIGEKIKEKVEERGVTQKAFASAIGMTPRNLERFFERSDISINQLVRASEFLNFDFVSLYIENSPHGKNIPQIVKENSVNYHNKLKDVSVQISISGDVETISKQLSSLLIKIQSEAEQRGLHLI
ncbi:MULTISPECIES: helix-turn-helix transcriptional regulator [Sphingobacterium]|uniref:Helix-turn-helix transcriptional regulator n=1 Tax=Sphingobacterium populi TaxID=1812824 RepID=A0ABW5UAE9_9SPHI|nr:helix-turn-helix transcriptional regulator [Sphingobacterium sp. CFCC 11742]